MVVMFLPAAALTGNEHERVATPSMCTVQAPHWAIPQPYLVPVRPIHSRNTHSNGVSGSASTSCVWPLMVRLVIFSVLSRSSEEESRTCIGILAPARALCYLAALCDALLRQGDPARGRPYNP